jgi:predicted nucleic acid-binding protein
MIHLDTSVVIDALTGHRRSAPRLRQLIAQGERTFLTALVLYEWRRGPRSTEEISDQEELFPSSEAIVFGPAEALAAASLYRRVKRPRGRDIDIAIAACAVTHQSRLWTLNVTDFNDIPGLRLL